MKIAVVVPPVSDLNTLYAAAPRLAAWLRKLGHEVDVIDLSLEVFLAMFSRPGLERLFAAIDPRTVSGDYEEVYLNGDRYIHVIESVVTFLQGRDPALAHRLLRPGVLPHGPYLREESPRARQDRYGKWGKVDHARHLATQAILDLSHLFQQTISPHYMLVNYAARLSKSTETFDAIADELARPSNVIEDMMYEAAERTLAQDLDLVCFTCPFPGMLMGSLYIGTWMQTHRPTTKRALGGGYPSTELRELSDPRVFDAVDYLVLDDGERPLERICAQVAGDAGVKLHKTFTRVGDQVVLHTDADTKAPRFRELPAPDYAGVHMDRYVHLLPVGANVFHRLLNDGPWLKLTAAHGCYWKKCTFCDIHLEYIDDFDPLSAKQIVDQMDAMHAATGLSSFHFTDEAAPPPLLVNLALELLRRGRDYQFFGNIRYDTSFTPDRCRLLAAAGMIAVTGGIEVASATLLPKINKGITVPNVIKVLESFNAAGIHCHAYLIYGFPGETLQDTVDSLDTLRQMFRARILHSGVFHRFSLTAHAPIAKAPEVYGIRIKKPGAQGFAHYDLDYERVSVPEPDPAVFDALDRALNAYVHGAYLDTPVEQWFKTLRAPSSAIAPDFVEQCRALPHPAKASEPRLCWLGGVPRFHHGLLQVSTEQGELYSTLVPEPFAAALARCHPATWPDAGPPRRADFPELFLEAMRPRGLVLV